MMMTLVPQTLPLEYVIAMAMASIITIVARQNERTDRVSCLSRYPGSQLVPTPATSRQANCKYRGCGMRVEL